MLKNYENDLNEIKKSLLSISDVVIDALEEASSIIKKENFSELKNINLSVKKLSHQSDDIDNLIVKTLALHAPEARDLRFIVSYLKISNDLLRVAGSIKEFTKLFRKSISDDLNKDSILEYTIPLLKSAHLSLKTSISMFEETEKEVIEEKFQRVSVEETKTDDLYSMTEKNILKLITKNIHLSKDYFDILTSLRRLEKVADRSVSIASLLQYAHIGGELSKS